MCVFDRSWYGRLLVERVEKFATIEQWTRAYNEIVEFERSLVLEGVILVKFYLQVSPDEQLDASRVGTTIRCGSGSSSTRTGATATSGTSTSKPPRTCSSAPITSRRRGTSCPARTRSGPG